MPELRIAFDPTNPGQFLACCGLWELLHLDGLYALAHFAVNPRLPRRAEFVLETPATVAVPSLLTKLKAATFAPDTGAGEIEKGLTPYRLHWNQRTFILDWWLDEFRQDKTVFKCWSGQVTPAKLFTELPSLLPESGDFMNYGVNTKTKFGLDPRSAWEALDIGFSPNEQKGADVFPAVELLACLGLQGFRPSGSRKNGFFYSLWLSPLPLIPARSVPWDGLPCAHHQFRVDARGSYRYLTFAQPVSERKTHA